MKERKLTPLAATETPQKPLSRLAWWLLFGVATYLMSLWFQTFKLFTLTPSLPNGLQWLGVMAALSGVVGLMVYDSYVVEARKGEIRKPFRPFEWMIQRRFLLGNPSHKEETVK